MHTFQDDQLRQLAEIGDLLDFPSDPAHLRIPCLHSVLDSQEKWHDVVEQIDYSFVSQIRLSSPVITRTPTVNLCRMKK
jgi:hypothetical protein